MSRHDGGAASRFEYLSKLGEGTYGVVYRARRWGDGANATQYAVKEIRCAGGDAAGEGVPTSALREVSLLMELDHPNCVRLVEVINDSERQAVAMVFELLDTDLDKLTRKHPRLLPQHPHLVKYYMWQVLQGIKYCHSRRIIHRDLKPQNLLIDIRANTVKVADFGLARAVGMPTRGLSPEVVTLWYRAPELLVHGSAYSAAVDLWSIGCIMFEMTFGVPLFPGHTDVDQLSRVFGVIGWPAEGAWPGVPEGSARTSITAAAQLPHRGDEHRLQSAIGSMGPHASDLLLRLLALDPSERLTAKDALCHSYFADMAQVLSHPPCLVGR